MPFNGSDFRLPDVRETSKKNERYGLSSSADARLEQLKLAQSQA